MKIAFHTRCKKNPDDRPLPINIADRTIAGGESFEARCFKIIFVRNGFLKIQINGKTLSGTAPCVYCLNELENPEISGEGAVSLVLFLPEILNFIHEQADSTDLTVKHLCRIFATNKTTLQNRFKKYTGHTIAAYLRSHRLSLSRSLLENTDLNISEITGKIGFKDMTGFERAFQKTYGMTPSEYRRSVKH